MKFFQVIPSETHIDFIGKFKFISSISLVLSIVAVGAIITKGFHYGVDFTGGTVMQVRFTPGKTAEEVRKTIADLGDPGASVVATSTDNKDYLITSQSLATAGEDPLNKRLLTKLGPQQVEIHQADVVGPKVGEELKGSAIKALFYSIILITVYIWFRFDFRFAPGATVAMVHDVILTSGFYLVTGREFTITAVAALLTIAGYSVNDTIVIYDRVRELLKLGGVGLPFPQLINKAINLTLSRTVLTSFVTLISIVPVYLFCSGDIQSFALAMIFGIFVGTYSTIYIAAPLTIYADQYFSKKERQTGRSIPTPAKA